MPQFHYRAAHNDGSIVEGKTNGLSESAVRSELETQGLCVFQLKGSNIRWDTAVARKRKGHIPLREFLIFNQQFVALIKAGLPILRTFDLLTERAANPTFRKALEEVREGIRGGASISEAMGAQPYSFPELYRGTIQSGEHTGNLIDVLQRYIAYIKLSIAIREKVGKALAYPAFLMVIGMGVVAFLTVFVIPTFVDVYAQSSASMPRPTQMLLDIVTSAVLWGPWALGVVLVSGLVGWFWSKTEVGKYQVHRVLLAFPLIGGIVSNNQIIRLSRTLATILAGGLPLLTALSMTAEAMTNTVFSRALVRAASRVREGTGLAASLKEERFLPRMTVEMIEVGESTGALESMLEEVADFHESEIDVYLNQLNWLEPILLLFMGILVGGIVVIMYLPIFNIAGTL